ncbi:unnamed protein product [Musa acuminata subsp. burmannicoides]
MAYCTRSTHPVPRHDSFGLWLTSILLFTAATTPTTKGCIEGERDALLDFKTGIVKDPSSSLSSWRGRVDCCRWSGVVCDNRTGHVVELNLQNSDPYNDETSIGGEIRPSLLLLTHLERLNLSNNDFVIPSQLGNLSSLRSLDLHSDGLSTDGLHWLSRLTSLRYLDMSFGNLSMASHNWLQAVNMLSSLEELHLQDCGLTDLPSSLSHVNLTALATLDISDNLFNFTIPNWLWKLHSLSYLDLSFSMFHGAIPAGIGNLTGLIELYLNNNSLSGPVPTEIGIWNSLEYIDLNLSGNLLFGTIPTEIGKLSNLIFLSLSNNSLKGTVSELHFDNLTELSEIDLSENSLVISVDYDWVPPFQLRSIQLNSCKLGPAFPRWLRSQNFIEDLGMSNTSIEDVLPDWFWNNSAFSINLSQNQINGTLPTSLEQMTNLDTLKLSMNLLEGPIPRLPPYLSYLNFYNNSFSGSLSSISLTLELELMDLSHNNINGSIPSFICNLTQLRILDLSSNQISGEIPSCWQETDSLFYINLADNKLSGEIPSSIEKLTQLRSLHLNNNSLHGHLPLSLKNCSGLVFLDLGDNKFSGSIPTWIAQNFQNLEVLRLCSNMFFGNIPTELGQLHHLHIIDLANNNLSGPIPRSFGNLNATKTFRQRKLTSLSQHIVYRALRRGQLYDTYDDSITLTIKGKSLIFSTIVYLVNIIDFSNNNLTGEIPVEIGSLSALQTLNLSRNNLVGQIPTTIGATKSLETLDLSFNKLSGDIPQSLSDLYYLNHLNLSYNNLSGVIPSGNQLQTLNDTSIYIGNAYLCGAPLTVSCYSIKSNNVIKEDNKDGSFMPSYYLSFILGYLVGLWSVFIIILFKKNWRVFYFQIVDKIYDKAYVISTHVIICILFHYFDHMGCRVETKGPVISQEDPLVIAESNGSTYHILYIIFIYTCSPLCLPDSLSRVNLTALTTLDLRGNFFNSTFPSWLFELRNLSYLAISNSELYGTVPAGFGNLTRLAQLDLSGNSLSGSIPVDLWSLASLTTLDLSHNSFTSPLLPEIGNTTSLSQLNLVQCFLVGSIPAEIGRLTSLTELRLSGNSLSGRIPAEIGNLSSVTQLDLGHNSLSGLIPVEIGKLSYLSALDLSDNSLEGTMSELHFVNLTELVVLYAYANPLTIRFDHDWMPPFQLQSIKVDTCDLGPAFPRWLRSQEFLIDIDLSNTSIEDTLPDWFWNSSSSTIMDINLSHNKIGGVLPASLESRIPVLPPNLQALDLSSNSLSGSLPSTISSQLGYLFLSHNYLHGSIPSSYVCDLQQLYALDLSNNQISGEIPRCRPEGSQLLFVNLANNKLRGKIPDSIGNLGNLQFLHLNNNSLFGRIPSSLKNCSRLAVIDLGNNKFSGSIPAWIGQSLRNLQVLLLRSNMFSGHIPLQLGRSSNLQIIDLSNNRLSGSVPHSFGNFSAMISASKSMASTVSNIMNFVLSSFVASESISLVTKGDEFSFSTILRFVKSIDLSNNDLSGVIPPEIGSLFALQTLNLSRNSFEGMIPKTMGDMKSLETLDLSFNKLSGVIPQSFSALNSLSHLNLSYNNLSGAIPSGNQLQTLDDASIYIGNVHLCGPPVTKSCSDDPNVDSTEEEYKQGSHVLSFYFGTGLGYLVGIWSVFVVMLFKKDWRLFYFATVDKMYDKAYVAVKIRMRN